MTKFIGLILFTKLFDLIKDDGMRNKGWILVIYCIFLAVILVASMDVISKLQESAKRLEIKVVELEIKTRPLEEATKKLAERAKKLEDLNKRLEAINKRLEEADKKLKSVK